MIARALAAVLLAMGARALLERRWSRHQLGRLLKADEAAGSARCPYCGGSGRDVGP